MPPLFLSAYQLLRLPANSAYNLQPTQEYKEKTNSGMILTKQKLNVHLHMYESDFIDYKCEKSNFLT